MATYETYAKRMQQREQSGKPDVYEYRSIPSLLRKQLAFIFNDALGPRGSKFNLHGKDHPNPAWHNIAKVMEREFEDFPSGKEEAARERCLQFNLHETNVDHWLSEVELVGAALGILIDRYGPTYIARDFEAATKVGEALEGINVRFRENGIGYQIENRKIVRVDDQFIHSEVVKPTLALLREGGYENANEDFMLAHRHYRAGDFKDSIVAANRAFESTLKAICKKRGWHYESGDRASELIAVLRNNGLFPDFMGKSLDTYIAMMKTGVPVIRNSAGGHGVSPDAEPVRDYLAAYALHLTAANILLSINASKKGV